MSALSTAAILGLAAASAGTSVASAAIQSHQAGKAVDAQTDAANKALAFQQQMYQQQQQAAAPYQQAGTATLGRLGQMVAQPAAQFNPANYQGGMPVSRPPSQGMPSTPQLPQQQALGAPAAPSPGLPPAGAQGGGETVTIQTPDGRTLQGFPRARLAEAMQRGAKVLG